MPTTGTQVWELASHAYPEGMTKTCAIGTLQCNLHWPDAHKCQRHSRRPRVYDANNALHARFIAYGAYNGKFNLRVKSKTANSFITKIGMFGDIDNTNTHASFGWIRTKSLAKKRLANTNLKLDKNDLNYNCTLLNSGHMHLFRLPSHPAVKIYIF